MRLLESSPSVETITPRQSPRTIGFHPLQCTHCGKFISNEDYENGKVKIEFIPDTEFTLEEVYYTHRSCLEKENNK